MAISALSKAGSWAKPWSLVGGHSLTFSWQEEAFGGDMLSRITALEMHI